jgi:hypothetical protein
VKVRSPESGACPSPLADFLSRYPLIELLRLAPRHRERFPLRGLQMLRQENNLSAMIGIVRNLTINRLHHRVRLPADLHRPVNVAIREWLKSGKNLLPSLLPQFH